MGQREGKGSGWGFCCPRAAREGTSSTGLAKPFARGQARSLPCQRSGPGNRRVVSVQDMQNDNKNAAQMSNATRREVSGTQAQRFGRRNLWPFAPTEISSGN